MIASITFFTQDGNTPLLEMEGRWAETDQPSVRDWRESKTDLLQIEFGIGAVRHLGIGFHDPKTQGFVAFNNDNYSYVDAKKPEHILTGENFRVEIRVRGPWIDETFTSFFSNTANGLEIVSASAVPK